MMSKRRWAGLGMGLMLAVGATEQALAAPPSEAQVRQLMQVFGVSTMLGQMNSQMAGMMSQQLPCVPASYWQNFVDAKATNDLTNQMVPVYQRHFTADDVAGLLKFYRSPLGQKVITQMPATMKEGMQIGQRWGRQRGQQMIANLQKQGTVNAQGRCPATGASQPKLGK